MAQKCDQFQKSLQSTWVINQTSPHFQVYSAIFKPCIYWLPRGHSDKERILLTMQEMQETLVRSLGWEDPL